MYIIRKIEKLRCVSCNEEFVPRTIHEEFTFYPYRGSYKVLDYKSHFKEIKPNEVINQMWITYCSNCGYVLRFKKTVAKLKKIYHSSPSNIESSYEEVEFNKPIAEYSDYLNDLLDELKKEITQKFEEVSLSAFISLFLNEKEGMGYEKDDFKFLIRFMANIETYHDNLLGKDNDLTLPDKINRIDFPVKLKEGLIEINSLRNKIVHKGYVMNDEEGTLIYDNYYEFIKYLLDKKIKPLIDKILQNSGYHFLEKNDIYQETSIFLQKYFYESYSPNTAIFNHVRAVIRELFLW